MTIPARHPRTMHLEPYWFNDSLAGLARGHRLGYKYADQDMQLTDGDPTALSVDDRPQAVVKHWGNRTRDGFTHIWTGNYLDHAKTVEQRVPYHGSEALVKLPWSVVQRLRRGPTGFSRYATFVEHLVQCQKYGIRMCCELKGPAGFEIDQVAQDMYTAALDTGGQMPYIMTLSCLGSNRLSAPRRLKAFKEAGFETALLPRGPKPSDFTRNWAPYIDAMWGSRSNPNW